MNDVKWDMVPLGLVAEFHTGWTPPSGDDKYYGGGHKWANISDVGSRDLYETERTISDYALERQAGAKPANPGDLLFPFKLSIGAVSFAREKMYTNEAIAVFPPNKKFNLRFFYYALPYFLLKNAGVNIYGAPLLNATLIKQARVPVPPLESQQRIAEYLDRETAEIDAAVADLDRYVELLEKRRLLIVDEILCKSKFPAAPIFTVASLKSGDSITSEYIQKSGEFPVYGGNGLRGYTNNYNQESDRILIGRQGALCGNIHLAKGPFFATEHALVVSPRDSINLVWFEHALRDLNLGNLSQASAQPGISAGEVVRQRVHLPPLSVQNEIATRISLEINQIDSIIADSTRLRDLLLKRRSVLITEVVTGRKQV